MGIARLLTATFLVTGAVLMGLGCWLMVKPRRRRDSIVSFVVGLACVLLTYFMPVIN
jgi:hypothetical protein